MDAPASRTAGAVPRLRCRRTRAARQVSAKARAGSPVLSATFLPHGVTFTSAYRVTWKANPQTFFSFGRIRFVKGRFYPACLDLSNASHRICSSTDGASWTAASGPPRAPASTGRFVFVGISAKLHTSPVDQTLTPRSGLARCRPGTPPGRRPPRCPAARLIAGG